MEQYKIKIKNWEGYKCPNCEELRTYPINMKIHMATECEKKEEVDWGF